MELFNKLQNHGSKMTRKTEEQPWRTENVTSEMKGRKYTYCKYTAHNKYYKYF